MEESPQVTAPKSNRGKKITIAIGLIIIIIVGVIVFLEPTVFVSNAKYRDGIYETTGNYRSPGGDETIKVKLTLVDNIVTEAEVISQGERPNAIKFQGIFIENYKEKVIGKNINEIRLRKVAGSSLTPRGFNDALKEIKSQARIQS